MNLINEKCINIYKPNDEVINAVANNYPYNPKVQYTEEKMMDENPGQFPPHNLNMKIGCVLMLLRNWNLSEGLANGTRLRLLEVGEKKRTMKCEILTGPRVKKPIVIFPILIFDDIYDYLEISNQ